MKTLKKISFVLAFLMLVQMLAACSGGTATSSTETSENNGSAVSTVTADSKYDSTDSNTTADSSFDGSHVRVGINADISDLAPFSANSNGRNSMLYALYETLGMLSGVGGELEGVIMKDYTTEDDLTYHIDIYDYVYDTAGNHITASDIVWCYEMAKQKGYSTSVGYIETATQTGDYSFDLTINASYIGGFANVIQSVPIVSQEAYEASSDEMAATPVGTSQYSVSDYISGSHVTLKKTNDYWQTDESLRTVYQKANVENITYTTIKEASQMSIALETGTIDMGLSMDSTEATRFMEGGESSDGYVVFDEITNIGNQIYLSGDPDGPLYSSKELRQAIFYTIDKQGLVDGVLDGYGRIEYTFGDESFSDFQDKWKEEDYYNYDLEKAKELFSESGYSEGDLTLRIMTDNTAQRNKVAQIIQGYLLQLGINSEILQYDSALFNTYKIDPSQWDICLDNTGASDYIVSGWRSKFDARQFELGTTNGWQDDTLQELLLDAISIENHNDETVDAFHQYLKEQAYAMGLFNHTFFTVAVEGITGVTFDSKMFVVVPAIEINS